MPPMHFLKRLLLQNHITFALSPPLKITDALGIKNIGIHDDFFDLGGHSLKAISLIEKINTHFSRKISIQHFNNASTIYKLSEMITHNPHEKISITVPMKISQTSAHNIFICHPASGMTSSLEPFVSLLPQEFSVYGLQDPSISERKLIFDSIREMAKSYLNSIQKIQPKGPYFLIGYSLGGTLLYEVAHQLQLQNETIKLLCLIDSWPLFSKQQHDEQHVKKLIQNTSLDLPEHLISLSWERVQLLLNHTPTITKQDMLLIKALQLSDDYSTIDHPLNHWSTFNHNKINCLTIDANHDSIISDKSSQIIINYLRDNKYI